MAAGNGFEKVTVHDLIADEVFMQWVMQPDAVLERHWKAVVDEKPEMKPVIEEAKRLINIRFEEEKVSASRKQLIFDRIREEAGLNEKTTGKIVSIRWPVWVAASVLVLVSVGAWLYSRNVETPTGGVVTGQRTAMLTTGGMLYLRDGREVSLQDLAGGTGDDQDIQQLVLTTDNKLEWNGASVAVDSVVSPLAKRFRMVLADGSRVWMNSGSVLRLSGQYEGGRRGASVTGQCYFEVTPDVDHPFSVVFDNRRLNVLGTEFDVSNYPKAIPAVTLASGLVQIEGDTFPTIVLKPGKQAIFMTPAGDPAVADVDVKRVVAWKEGVFAFYKEPITSVMNQFATWYGVEIVYEGAKPELPISGSIPRDIGLKRALSVLRDTGVDMTFAVNGQTVVIRKTN